jgi:3',5'-cyclic AMP phosphodiesterase CpdA
MPDFLLAHLSDPHLGPLPSPRLGELMGKRAIGYFNWTRNRIGRHAPHVLDAIVADIKAQQPQHVAVTGDLVNIALPQEFAMARSWLHSVGPPHDVTLVPGNHDAYVPATRNMFLRAWADYLTADGASSVTFPFLRRRGPLALIGVSTAVPTAPLLATGKLGNTQLNALGKLLADLAREQDLFRVLLIHHPLQSLRPARYKRLIDADQVSALIRRHGVDLILHGHDHRHALTWIEGPANQKIPSLGVPSASAVAHGRSEPASYNLIRVSREAETWHCEVTVRGFTSRSHTIGEIGRRRLM